MFDKKNVSERYNVSEKYILHLLYFSILFLCLNCIVNKSNIVFFLDWFYEINFDISIFVNLYHIVNSYQNSHKYKFTKYLP